MAGIWVFVIVHYREWGENKGREKVLLQKRCKISKRKY